MAARLGVKVTAISNAVVVEKMPAKWFLVVREMCDEHGLDCPESLFSFSDVSSVRQDRGAA